MKNIIMAVAAMYILVGSSGAYAQKRTKTIHENFNIGNDAVLEIITSYADIEFETWNRNEIDIVAVIEIEGATPEEVEANFTNIPIKIIGNSKKIEISTGSKHRQLLAFDADSFRNLDIDILDDLDWNEHEIEISALPMIPEIMEIPPMPPMNIQHFDYEAYKKDGEAYMKEWKKEFDKSFSKEYQDKLEEWGKRMEVKREEIREKRQERVEERQEAIQERIGKMQEAQEKRKEVMEEARSQRGEEMELKRREQRDRNQHKKMVLERDSLKLKREELFEMGDKHRQGPNIFYFSDKGDHRNYKIKKTIKIKLPKSTKIIMNVRHGEVKLAENTNNISATLSYATLLASTIDGDKTSINASYSPVSVQKWNYGELKTDYSERVHIKEVGNLRLNATFSDVTIESLLSKAVIKNDFGPLSINAVSKDFEDLEIQLQNAELRCNLPTTAYNIVVNSSNSKVEFPKDLGLQKNKNGYSTSYKGYNGKKDSGKSIVINSKYSDIKLQ
ncbi:hypothetical protein KCTC52924_02489 [Arenibacter antarcticus]|uniref:Trichohyalin-plectin-homology domain domain-containing protein n=1 Tax=Arenibacter antarcticus TaxID=2040469 RepID=A0ABW5VJD0_9FLAO|nr:trichohyalin-plectin-homology domain domain-containing protein [Arenibacter sp. H213]MCM4168796.1 hypothetical protein [Arenibacter sp. H213]